MAIKTAYNQIKPYRTKDGSEIRELMHPDHTGTGSISLAEALVDIGQETECHRHLRSEEIYFIAEGGGIMTLGGERFSVQAGDTIFIPPGTPHKMGNTGKSVLKILCCCWPPYAHDDTQIVNSEL